jgi:phospho-N-acetylmuramoyl-pentapeptide-transferase
MLVLTKSLFALMIGFIISTIFGLFLIPILKKVKADQRINVYVDAHKSKSGTPTMGGFIFIIPCLITVLILSQPQ